MATPNETLTQNPATRSPMVAAAGVNTAGGLVGTIANIFQARANRNWQEHMSDKQNAFNAEQAELQRNWEEQMWHQQNAYNTPLEQMKRMLEAGINPNSAVQTLTNAAANVGGGSAASASSVPNPVNYENGSMLADSLTSVPNAILQMQQAKKLAKETNWIDTEKKASVDQIKTATEKVRSEIKLNEQTWKYLEEANPLFIGKTKEEINQIVKAVELTSQQIEESKQRVKESQANQGLIEAETHKTNVEITGVNYDNAVKKLKADLAKQGILCDTNPLMSLLSVALSGNGAEVLSSLSKAIEDMLPSVPDALGNIASGVGKAGNKLSQMFMSMFMLFNNLLR